jgi:uncharacterized membrane protein YgdD (TMEM256/DUF423 family)
MFPAFSPRACLAVAALAGLLAVGLDAAGAHALGPDPDPARLRLLELATRYQLVHAVALVGLAALSWTTPASSGRWLRLSAGAFTFGIVLFCGGLTVRALAETTALGPVVPIGGTALLLGWAGLLVHALRS